MQAHAAPDTPVRRLPAHATCEAWTQQLPEAPACKPQTEIACACSQAGQYFNKIQCFCFDEQRLLPGETVDMPVFFYIDPEFLTDRTMNRCNTMTLSYTFFRSTDL